MLRYLHCQLIYRRGAMYKEWASLSTDRDQPFSATSLRHDQHSHGSGSHEGQTGVLIKLMYVAHTHILSLTFTMPFLS